MDDISNYVESSKNVTFYISIALVLILIFIISPLEKYSFCYIAKVIIVVILFYAIIKNFMSAQDFSRSTNIDFFDGSWNDNKSNVIYSYIFTFFILLLAFSVIKTLF
jgi:hypothetical protein